MQKFDEQERMKQEKKETTLRLLKAKKMREQQILAKGERSIFSKIYLFSQKIIH